jgi:hypothetical protein
VLQFFGSKINIKVILKKRKTKVSRINFISVCTKERARKSNEKQMKFHTHTRKHDVEAPKVSNLFGHSLLVAN